MSNIENILTILNFEIEINKLLRLFHLCGLLCIKLIRLVFKKREHGKKEFLVSGVEGPSREIAASRRLKQETRPTHGSFSATNKVQVVEVPSPERVARNLTWTVGLLLSRARAPKLPKQATDRPCVKVSGAPIPRQPESPFPFPCTIQKFLL